MNTGGPASEKTLLDEFAGQALVGLCSSWYDRHKDDPETQRGHGPTLISQSAYTHAEAMLAEKARREAAGNGSAQPREVDDDYWAKFQDGIIITFEPTMGWCASIREGSLGSGNTIAEAVANLRTMWEERSAAPVVQESSTTDDAMKMAQLQSANRELVEALENVLATQIDPNGSKACRDARAILAKHKGAK